MLYTYKICCQYFVLLTVDCPCIGVSPSQRQGHWLSCSPLYFHHEEQGLLCSWCLINIFFSRLIIIKEAVLWDYYYVSILLYMCQTVLSSSYFSSYKTVYRRFISVHLSKWLSPTLKQSYRSIGTFTGSVGKSNCLF